MANLLLTVLWAAKTYKIIYEILPRYKPLFIPIVSELANNGKVRTLKSGLLFVTVATTI